MKYALKFTIPMNALTSVVVVGLVALSKVFSLSWVDVTPPTEKITPNNSICGTPKMHF